MLQTCDTEFFCTVTEIQNVSYLLKVSYQPNTIVNEEVNFMSTYGSVNSMKHA